MKNDQSKIITEKLRKHIGSLIEDSHYVRIIAIDKAPYLDAFIRGESFPPFEIEIQPSSKCNLKCKWCIGEEIQARNQVMNLPDIINADNIGRIVEGILETRQNGLGVEIVKFSGFIGEPLSRKEAVLSAIQRLACACVKVGMFTNGVLMTEDTWEILANISYVHVSLDSGPRSFSWCKENKSPDNPHSTKTFDLILDNIRGLDRQRKKTGWRKDLKINVGYVVINENYDEIYETSRLVRDAGADSIRFKYDITGGGYELFKAGTHNEAFSQIERAHADFHNPPEFSVSSIHSRDDLENNKFANWKCSDGCYYQHFTSTIGSDGNVYICDHNTMLNATTFGNAITRPFSEIWDSKLRRYSINGTSKICKCSVCPPFGRRVNAFLSEIVDYRERYGIEVVVSALELLRNEYKTVNRGGGW